MRDRKRKFNGMEICFYYEKSSGIMEVRVVDMKNNTEIEKFRRVGFHNILEHYKDNDNFRRINNV